MNWLRIGHVSTFPGGKLRKSNLQFLMDEKSWKIWKSIQRIVGIWPDERPFNIVQRGSTVWFLLSCHRTCLSHVHTTFRPLDGWRIGPERRDGWRTLWWVSKLIRRLWWICPYSKLVDGTVYNPVINNCRMNVLMRINRDCRSEFWAEVRSSRYNTWNYSLCVMILTWRNQGGTVDCSRYFGRIFMSWCNVTNDNTLYPVTICINIREDFHRGKILWKWNIQRCDQNRV